MVKEKLVMSPLNIKQYVQLKDTVYEVVHTDVFCLIHYIVQL